MTFSRCEDNLLNKLTFESEETGAETGEVSSSNLVLMDRSGHQRSGEEEEEVRKVHPRWSL